ncbi:MAG: hypothetical protein ACUVR0_01985 [Candidatus Aminicenantales bacterium]
MELETRVKRAPLKELAKRDQRSSKREKGLVLEELVDLTGYNRCYTSWLGHNRGRRISTS